MSAMWAIVRRDLLMVMRRKSEVLTALFFFVIVSSLFPLGIGPEPALLRKIATAEYDGLGDISTLADPSVVAHLIETHKTMNVA